MSRGQSSLQSQSTSLIVGGIYISVAISSAPLNAHHCFAVFLVQKTNVIHFFISAVRALDGPLMNAMNSSKVAAVCDKWEGETNEQKKREESGAEKQRTCGSGREGR